MVTGRKTAARNGLTARLFGFARRWRDGDVEGVESGRYLAKWVVLALVIGAVAGFGALAFYRSIQFVNAHLLGTIAGVHPPEPAGEGGDATIRPFGHPWLVPVITALGGLVSGLLVFTLAPEAEGHGTDAAIAAFHHKAGQIRARIAPIKLIASAITIGSGGSAGREGPAAQISATVGSVLADLLGLSAADRRLCVAVGMGAGIGAIFRAPLGGAMLAAEILYIHDLEAEALIPSLIAAITGYAIFGAFTGWEPIFGTQGGITFDQPVQLVYFALLGLICGAIGLLYARGFYGIEHLFHRLPLPRIVKPALGGLLVGLIALALPQALGTGYGWVQLGMDERLLQIPLWVVLLLPFAKILTTGLSIGSGGSGGIFGPGMVIGGLTGAAFWRLGRDLLPGMPAQPASFTIVAMMALFGGIAHAPLAVMIMVAEMTGNLTLLAPAMVAVGLATLVVGDRSIYRSQLPSRVDSPAHRYRYAFPLLATLTVADALEPAPLVLRDDEPRGGGGADRRRRHAGSAGARRRGAGCGRADGRRCRAGQGGWRDGGIRARGDGRAEDALHRRDGARRRARLARHRRHHLGTRARRRRGAPCGADQRAGHRHRLPGGAGARRAARGGTRDRYCCWRCASGRIRHSSAARCATWRCRPARCSFRGGEARW
ncbi:MAG: chloride channel protein [Chloroflexia bacterium]